jgi:hypothetical protein
LATEELVARRFHELQMHMQGLNNTKGRDGTEYPPPAEQWQEWATSALNLLESALGPESTHARLFRAAYEKGRNASAVNGAKGIFRAASADYEGGYIFNVERRISGEILGDFVALAKAALAEGSKDVAAVLAAAALEDTLKRFASAEGLDVDDKSMNEVVAALKTKGLVSGAQKTLLDTMPKLRDYAMHANWDKLSTSDVGSIIGFVEQFLLAHF